MNKGVGRGARRGQRRSGRRQWPVEGESGEGGLRERVLVSRARVCVRANREGWGLGVGVGGKGAFVEEQPMVCVAGVGAAVDWCEK